MFGGGGFHGGFGAPKPLAAAGSGASANIDAAIATPLNVINLLLLIAYLLFIQSSKSDAADPRICLSLVQQSPHLSRCPSNKKGRADNRNTDRH